MPAGNLRYRIGFYQRNGAVVGSPPPPDYGSGPDYATTPTFIVRANIDERPGGEQILAARLVGKNFVTITVRQSSQTDTVDTDWMCKNEDSSESYNIRSVVDPNKNDSDHGMWWDMLCEKGVAI
jgi:Phage head-tail joining protein